MAVSACSGARSEATPQATVPSPSYNAQISLQEARDAYAQFVTQFEAVTARGGEDAAVLSYVAVGDALSLATNSAAEFASKHYRSVGHSTIVSATLQYADTSRAAIYICEDHSGVDVLDDEGRSIAVNDRQTLFPYVATLLEVGGELKLSSLTTWSGGGICS